MKHKYHKYKKVNLARDTWKKVDGRKVIIKAKPYEVYKCMLLNCPHYVPVVQAEGKVCICNRCGENMEITKITLRLTYPHCIDCTAGKKEPMESTLDFISGLES